MGKRKLAKPPSKKEQLKTKSHRTTWIIVGVLAVALVGMVAFTLYTGGTRETSVMGGHGGARREPCPGFHIAALQWTGYLPVQSTG